MIQILENNQIVVISQILAGIQKLEHFPFLHPIRATTVEYNDRPRASEKTRFWKKSFFDTSKMNKRNNDLHTHSFKQVIEIVDNHHAWSLSDSTSIEPFKDPETVVNTAREIWFQNLTTDSLLRLTTNPQNSIYIAEATLSNSFESTNSVQTSDNTFLNELAEAHGRIGESTATNRYISTLTDPVDLIRIQLPSQYKKQILENSLDEADEIAVIADKLHDSILQVVREFPD